jgi:hypothetical protein
MEQQRLKDGIDYGRFIEDRYGNFPAAVRDEMIQVLRDFVEHLSACPGEHFVAHLRQDTSHTHTSGGESDLFGSSVYVPHFDDYWHFGSVTGSPIRLGHDEEWLHVLEGDYWTGRYDVQKPSCGLHAFQAAKDPTEAKTLTGSFDAAFRMVSFFDVIDTLVFSLDSVKENKDRLKKDDLNISFNRKVSILIGDDEIGRWLDANTGPTYQFFHLLPIITWTLDCESKRYMEWREKQKMVVEFERLYREAYPHIAAVAALIMVTSKSHNGYLSEFKQRLMADLGI